MSDLHTLYVGHFVLDGKFARTTIDPTTKLGKPVVRASLDRNVVDQSATNTCSDAVRRSRWRMWWDNGYLVVDQFNDPLAILFVTRLVEEIQGIILDKTMRVVDPQELLGNS